MCVCVCVSVYLCICLSVCLYVCHPACLLNSLPACLPKRLANLVWHIRSDGWYLYRIGGIPSDRTSGCSWVRLSGFVVYILPEVNT